MNEPIHPHRSPILPTQSPHTPFHRTSLFSLQQCEDPLTPFLSRSPSHCTCTVLLHLVIANTQMNGDQKIIELLTKISNTLEEIKAQNAIAQPAVARAPSKLPPPPTASAPAKRRCIQHSPNLATAPKPATIVEEKPKPAETKPSSDYYTEFVTKFVDPAVKCSNELGEQFTALVEIATLDPA